MQGKNCDFTEIVRDAALVFEELKRKEIISRYLGKPLEEFKGEPQQKEDLVSLYLHPQEVVDIEEEEVVVKRFNRDISYQKDIKKKNLVFQVLSSNKRVDRAPEVIYRLQVRFNKIKKREQ